MKGKRYLIDRIFCLLMAGLLVFFITACGDTAETTSEPVSTEETEAETEDETEEEQDTAADEDVSEEDAGEDALFTNEKEEKEADADTEDEAESTVKSEVEAVPYLEFDNKTVLDDKEKRGDTVIYRGSYESPVLSDASALTYPELAEALEKNAEEAYSEYQTSREELVDDASERYGDDPDYFEYGSYENYTYAWLRRADEKVMSYVSYYSSFQGGAHGMYGQTGYTYDTKTGKRLVLKDVLKDTSKLNDILEKEILANYDKKDFEDLKGRLAQYDPEITAAGDEEESYAYEWCLLPTGIEFYFEPYSLSYYAAGEQDILLTYEDYPDLVKEAYMTDGDQGFIYEFYGDLEIFDITGDGKRDSLWVEAENMDENNYADGISITINGKQKAVKDVSFYNNGGSTRSAYYIQMPDGKQYIYTEAVADDIDHELFVFDLNKGKVKYVDSSSSYPADIVKWNKDFFYYRMAGTDPDRIELFRDINILVTFLASAPHHVGIKGMPEIDGPYKPVSIPEECTLRSTKDLTCDIVNEDGKVLSEKETIKAGETFYIVATDNETYVDARMSDDRIARLNLTSTKYPCEIDGVPADECFEKLYYAG